MERLVLDLASIKFQDNCRKETIKTCASNTSCCDIYNYGVMEDAHGQTKTCQLTQQYYDLQANSGVMRDLNNFGVNLMDTKPEFLASKILDKVNPLLAASGPEALTNAVKVLDSGLIEGTDPNANTFALSDDDNQSILTQESYSDSNSSDGIDAEDEEEFSSNYETDNKEDVLDGETSTARTGFRYAKGPPVQRRTVLSRASKTNALNKTNLRTLMKPARQRKTTKAKVSSDSTNLTLSQLKKLYAKQKKLTNFRPSSLETIFEEPQPVASTSRAPKNSPTVKHNEGVPDLDGTDRMRFYSVKKSRRTLDCTDGRNVSKAQIKQRRAKIKKVFGRRTPLPKIPLDYFLKCLNSEEETDFEIRSSVADSTVTNSVKNSLATRSAFGKRLTESSKIGTLNSNRSRVIVNNTTVIRDFMPVETTNNVEAMDADTDDMGIATAVETVDILAESVEMTPNNKTDFISSNIINGALDIDLQETNFGNSFG